MSPMLGKNADEPHNVTMSPPDTLINPLSFVGGYCLPRDPTDILVASGQVWESCARGQEF